MQYEMDRGFGYGDSGADAVWTDAFVSYIRLPAYSLLLIVF